MKVRILLKAKKDWSTYTVGDTMTLYNDVFDKNIGIAFYPIEKDKWEVISYDIYTGVNDKHEKEIYQRDVICAHEDRWGVIEFDKGLFGINWDYGTKNQTMIGAWGNETNLRKIYDGFNREIEVVGTLYEHSHLLKKNYE